MGHLNKHWGEGEEVGNKFKNHQAGRRGCLLAHKSIETKQPENPGSHWWYDESSKVNENNRKIWSKNLKIEGKFVSKMCSIYWATDFPKIRWMS